MSKRSAPALILSLGITAGLIAGSLWLLGKTSPGLLPVLTGQPGQPSGGIFGERSTELKILGDTFSGYSTFRNNEFQQTLSQAGVTLSYADEFDQKLRAEQLSQGQADLMVTTLDQFLQQRPQGKIVGLIDRTVGADAVVLNTKRYPNLKSLLDLNQLVQQEKAQGRRVGIAFAGDTPSEYLALVLDTKFDAFNLADFEITRVADASEAWALMQNPDQNVAIAVIWEPYVTQARQQGYTVVLSSQDAPGAIVDVLVASDRLIQSRPEMISELLEAYYRRIDTNVRDSSQLQAQIAEDGNLSPNDAAAVIQGIEFFTATEAQTWLKDGTLERRIGSTAAVLVLAGRLQDIPQSGELFTDQFIAQAAGNTQTLIDLVRADNPELADRLAGRERAVSVAPTLQASQIQTAPNIGNLQVRGQVGFGTGSSQLTAEGRQTLDQLANEIKEFNAQTVAVRVIGHTSRTGSATFNQTLSRQRAQVVANYFRGRGVQHNLLPEGKGFSEPLPGIAPTDSRNQRTEIRLVRIN
ncbi:MAG: phosphate ABC transporter substrate-binding/OmpA family protein [Oculatellaceae cyanobacterium bins.114]|nr:phosphate ABC transporter substrate-binding/OmpA family protein [Oculatellaceae cyanobacterium bins.114]